MRVLVAAMGSRGDVQPMLALAVALRARGGIARAIARIEALV
jgi:UDP:flavonoid glycosyltransferase YjiC (YdhE family)